MSITLLLTLLVAGLLALLPVWRLRLAGWPAGWLLTAWLVYGAWILVAIRFPGPTRFLLPLLVLAYVAPFVAGPDRLSRMVSARHRPEPGTIINVTPRPPAELPESTRRVEGEVVDAPGAEDEPAGDDDAPSDVRETRS